VTTRGDAVSDTKRVAILQSCYIPWKGYFDLINLVDEFILFDDRQYTRRDWRNRNRVKTAQGTIWLTVPVEVKGRFAQRICDTRTQGDAWRRRHWQTLVHAYGASPHFEEFRDRFEALYLARAERFLSRINHAFITAVCETLGIETRISWSTDYAATGDRSERLLSLCVAASATEYVSGPSARSYLDEGIFGDHGVAVTYMDYSGYREYPQVHPPFEHDVTILDLLFNTGPEARAYMKSFSQNSSRSGALA
jgi:hypothetical protein